jgi:hypothetical protein
LRGHGAFSSLLERLPASRGVPVLTHANFRSLLF